MLKFKIDNDTHSELDDALKPFYEQVGDEFQLKVDGAPDTGEVERLKAHNEKLIGEKRQRDEAARQAEAERERIEQEAAKKNGDFESLEKSYQEKLAESQARIEQMTREREQSVISSSSQKLASELSNDTNNQELLQTFIKSRLTIIDGQVKVTDGDGNVSANTLTDLATEFKSSGKYDSLLTGTDASGTGGSGQSVPPQTDPTALTALERKQLKDSDPAAFARLYPS